MANGKKESTESQKTTYSITTENIKTDLDPQLQRLLLEIKAGHQPDSTLVATRDDGALLVIA